MNPNIALSYKNPEFTTPYQLEAGASELRKNDLVNAIAQNKMQQENALSSLWQQSGGDVEKVKQGLYQAGMGDKAMEIEQHQREVEKEKRIAVKQDFELRAAKLSKINEVLSTATPDTWHISKQELVALNDGVDDGSLPEQFDPALVQDATNKVIGAKGMIDQKAREQGIELEWAKFANLQQHQTSMLEETKRGHDLQAQNQPLMQVVDPSTGLPKYVKRNEAEGQQAYSPTGITNKALPAGQAKQVIGVKNLSDSIDEYTNQLDSFKLGDIISPNANAAMGTKYNNMMLQAKEAYNLGVLNGPDYEILTSVITDPRSFKGVITSNKALKGQATELKRIMQKIGTTAGSIQQNNTGGFDVTSDNEGGQLPPYLPGEENDPDFADFMKEKGLK